MLTSLDGRSAATVERAGAAGMEDVSPETIASADLILSIVPPGEAVALAKALVTRLRESRHKPVYIDCNALSPKTKTEIAGTLAETGCDIIDGAIVGAPPRPGEKGPRIYVSGDRSDRASALRTLGLDLRQIDGPIGAAAALKISYDLPSTSSAVWIADVIAWIGLLAAPSTTSIAATLMLHIRIFD